MIIIISVKRQGEPLKEKIMKLSEMIKQLETLKEKFGDLQIGTWTDECDWFEVDELIEDTSDISSGFITIDLK